MSDRSEDVSRRGFLMATAGGAAAAGVAGTAAAQETTQTGGTATANGTATNGTAANGTSAPEGTEGGGGGGGGGGIPDLGGYLDDANTYGGSVTDKTGQSTVTVQVGAGDGFAFSPAGVKVDNGATVQWEWTGEGGAHNVVADEGPIDSGSAVGGSGVKYEHTFEEDGIYKYYCSPHQGQGMLGAVVVGTDYPTIEPESGGGGGGPALPGSAKTIGVATALVMSASLGLSYIFMKYGGDYETPE
ncbi:halocyanin domain-containing protein [Halorientalis pallida]|uniref:Halocyanin domain-containing protein n=1 Tax=Halorientalis pallida TaxID=2479928 RepID=A0A498KR76_9EURY|nr:halocyanin domain-containing protein [Halorientalis pallida]RXK46214.1 halocyanin domain-containing protein [Halorientalis pallida]